MHLSAMLSMMIYPEMLILLRLMLLPCFSEKDALDITEYQSSVKGRSTISSVEIVSVYPLCVSTIMPFYELCSQMAIFLCAIMLLEILLK